MISCSTVSIDKHYHRVGHVVTFEYVSLLLVLDSMHRLRLRLLFISIVDTGLPYRLISSYNGPILLSLLNSPLILIPIALVNLRLWLFPLINRLIWAI